jgi:hypothetical protein
VTGPLVADRAAGVSVLDTHRNIVYQTVFDARRKIRPELVANGCLPEEARRP